MENKLQQLTEKLYNDGLSKGQQEGQAILDKANAQAKTIIEHANAQAAAIVEKAKNDANQLHNTTISEIQLASNQMVSALRQQVSTTITAAIFESQVRDSYKDSSFVKELMVKAIESFDKNSDEGVKVIVPQGFEELVKEVACDKLNKGVEIVTTSKIKVPFRIAPANAGYVVSFTDEDFNALFKSYIRPLVSDLLYNK